MGKLRWFIPTFEGDVLLSREDDGTTILRAYELTDGEAKALEVLRKRALHSPFLGAPWCASEKEFLPLVDPQYRTKDGLAITLHAKIEDVEAVLAKALNPKGRKLFSAVKFSDGSIERIHRGPGGEVKLDSYRINAKAIDDALPPAERERARRAREEKEKEARAAATLKEPVIGCPTPEFPEADIRASRALEAFLDEDQLRDYRKKGAFVSVGHDTGHRYVIQNREAPLPLRNTSKGIFGGGIYDLDEERTICCHDWDVPPPEEMLALHLCLRIPGMERSIRSLPHAF
ncbi:MAG TPA: hypothetical protein VMI75_03950 [Polyangiaceae bacterium]|nr:hypothetical protein [Polyangiaceae bacterium]